MPSTYGFYIPSAFLVWGDGLRRFYPWQWTMTGPSNSETIRHWTVGLIDAQNKNGSCGVVPQNKQTFVPRLRCIPKVLHRRILLAADRRLFFRRGSRQLFIGEAWATTLGFFCDGLTLTKSILRVYLGTSRLNTLDSEWRIGLMNAEQSPDVVASLLNCLQSGSMSRWRADMA